MNLLFTLARINVPRFLRRRELENLFSLTANAFDRPMPSTKGKSFAECLELYAKFTGKSANELSDHNGSWDATGEKLRRIADSLGLRLRNLFGVSTREDVMEAARLLYQMIGIDFHGSAKGDITVTRCYFDRHYSPTTCKLMSSFDEGLLAGLAGDGKLVFVRQRTEGYPCCKAYFYFKEAGQ